MNSLAYLLILISAIVHASWNAATRRLKGNTPVLVLGHLLGALLTLPWIFQLQEFWTTVVTGELYVKLLPSVISHASYMALLGKIYFDLKMKFFPTRNLTFVTWRANIQIMSMYVLSG